MREEILEAIKNYLAKIRHADPETMTEETDFSKDMGGTSLEFAQLAAYLESEYDVDLPYMAFCRKKTLGDMADFVEESM